VRVSVPGQIAGDSKSLAGEVSRRLDLAVRTALWELGIYRPSHTSGDVKPGVMTPDSQSRAQMTFP